MLSFLLGAVTGAVAATVTLPPTVHVAGLYVTTTVAARGPKPTAALRARNVRIDVSARDPFTTHEVLEAIAPIPIESARVIVQRYGVTNVELASPIGRDQLLEEYRAADVLFLHLNAYRAFERVLPSKLFEYAALGKPLWAGVAGFAAEFTKSEIPNSAVFPPCDINSAVGSLDDLILEDMPRTEFVGKYQRGVITGQLAEQVLAVARNEGRALVQG